MLIGLLAGASWGWGAPKGGKAATASTPEKDPWSVLRTIYPYHLQGVAVSEPQADGSRWIVAAEPPPAVTIPALLGTDPEHLSNPEVRTHGVGHDGWVRDIVLHAAPMPEADLEALCVRLNKAMFGTSYKAYTYDIPHQAKQPDFHLGEAHFDLHVSTSDLQGWTLAGTLQFRPALGGAAQPLAAWLKQGARGVYFSTEEGLVAWLLPKGESVEAQKFAARQFALDSDLVLGAISGGEGVAIMARERSVPVTTLPPLRVETIFQLAQAHTYGLAQSYERKNAFSGRFDNAHDWAPIFLSQQLIDTEYGSLLNITDQLLKSWSEGGTVRYENFLYPDPGRYPFPRPLMKHLGVSEVTYNWNTEGAGYGVESGPYAILALNRTGALPVSYFPGGGSGEGVKAASTMTAEDAAYGYFSELGDPNLARVVQYAALYQAFVNLKVGGDAPFSHQANRAHPLLVSEAVHVYQMLHQRAEGDLLRIVAPQIEASVKKVLPEIDQMIRKQEAKQGIKLTPAERAKYTSEDANRYRGQVLDSYRKEIANCRQTLDAVVGGGEAGPALEKFVLDQDTEAKQKAADTIRELVDLVAVREKLVKDGADHANGYIHTPAVVVSWNTKQEEGQILVGGHNLDAGVTIFREDAAQPAGRISLQHTRSGGDEIVFNSADKTRVTEVVRDIGRRERDLSKLWPEVEKRFAETAARPTRTVVEALQLGTHPETTLRGLRPSDAPSGRGALPGWHSEPILARDSAASAQVQKATGRSPIIVRGAPEGYEVVAGEPPNLRKALARNFAAVNDVLEQMAGEYLEKGSEKVVLNMELSEAEMSSFRQTRELRDLTKKMLRVEGKEPLKPGALDALHTYDFSKMTFSEIERTSLEGGGERLTATFEAPAKAAGKASLTGKLRMYCKKVMSSTAFENVKRFISGGLREVGPETTFESVQQKVRVLSESFQDGTTTEIEVLGLNFVQVEKVPHATDEPSVHRTA